MHITAEELLEAVVELCAAWFRHYVGNDKTFCRRYTAHHLYKTRAACDRLRVLGLFGCCPLCKTVALLPARFQI